jgi:hypothetical protein
MKVEEETLRLLHCCAKVRDPVRQRPPQGVIWSIDIVISLASWMYSSDEKEGCSRVRDLREGHTRKKSENVPSHMCFIPTVSFSHADNPNVQTSYSCGYE